MRRRIAVQSTIYAEIVTLSYGASVTALGEASGWIAAAGFALIGAPFVALMINAALFDDINAHAEDAS